jgi:hypothetical protein
VGGLTPTTNTTAPIRHRLPDFLREPFASPRRRRARASAVPRKAVARRGGVDDNPPGRARREVDVAGKGEGNPGMATVQPAGLSRPHTGARPRTRLAHNDCRSTLSSRYLRDTSTSQHPAQNRLVCRRFRACSSVRSICLKIVVSPVRVRVSPSQAPNPASTQDSLVDGALLQDARSTCQQIVCRRSRISAPGLGCWHSNSRHRAARVLMRGLLPRPARRW